MNETKTLNDVRTKLEYAPIQPSETDPTAPTARQVLEKLFPDPHIVAESSQGTVRGAERVLVVVDVDGIQFGWVEDRAPKAGPFFVQWVWKVENVDGIGWVDDGES